MCVLVLACGGSTAGTTTAPDSGSTSDSGSGSDAQSAADSTSSSDAQSAADSMLGSDAPPPPDSSSGGEVPIQHRPSGAACPQQRGPGMLPSGCPWDAGLMPMCLHDSDCTQGNSGRCLPATLTPLPCAVACSYDECFADTDCPSNQPCDCRQSATDNAPNTCVGGSQCRIDSDCGPGRYCSPSAGYGSFNCGYAYFCHTAADTCVNDTDCDSGRCQYDSTAGHWHCGGPLCAPPP
jgi:hypothetical protein